MDEELKARAIQAAKEASIQKLDLSALDKYLEVA